LFHLVINSFFLSYLTRRFSIIVARQFGSTTTEEKRKSGMTFKKHFPSVLL
jgi:hypothetical protein